MMEQAGRIASTFNRAIARFVALPLLKVYRVVGSPIASMLGSRCRFYPSCSQYAEESFRTHGFFRGFFLSTIRLAKCNPLHPGGVDHVPPRGYWKHPSCDHDHTHDDNDQDEKEVYRAVVTHS